MSLATQPGTLTSAFGSGKYIIDSAPQFGHLCSRGDNPTKSHTDCPAVVDGDSFWINFLSSKPHYIINAAKLGCHCKSDHVFCFFKLLADTLLSHTGCGRGSAGQDARGG